MNPFEKIFNYQIMARLHETGTFAFTSQERAWLGAMLQQPAAAIAFSPETLDNYRRLLAYERPAPWTEHMIEKAGSAEQQPVHPLLRPLRRLIAERTGLLLTHAVKDGRIFEDQPAFPYKLEYSMVKKDWVLIWYHLQKQTTMRTKLPHLLKLGPLPLSDEETGNAERAIGRLLAQRREAADIVVVRLYNKELSRILYAFSCFEKEVVYDEAEDTYTIRLTYDADESEYVLSKLRFLGQRVCVAANDRMKERMKETAAKALARYGQPVPDRAGTALLPEPRS